MVSFVCVSVTFGTPVKCAQTTLILSQKYTKATLLNMRFVLEAGNLWDRV